MPKRILHVDDDRNIRDTVRLALNLLGRWEVDGASDGAEALRKLQCNDYDLLITDLKMAHMRGDELIRKALELKGKTLNYLILSAVDGSSWSNIYDQARFMSLPMDPQKLVERVKLLLNES